MTEEKVKGKTSPYIPYVSPTAPSLTVFLGYKNGKLITVVESVADDYERAVDVDYVVTNPREVEKQIAEWKRKVLR